MGLGREKPETAAGLRGKRLKEIRRDPGRDACGILAIAELAGPPSSDLVRLALAGLSRMEHRGGTLEGTGDGAGLLLAPERSFFERFLAPGRQLASPKEPLVVGTVFFLRGERNIPELTREFDMCLRREGLSPLGWRRAPVEVAALGRRAQEDAPLIYQILVAKGHRREAQLYEALHQAKAVIESRVGDLLTIVSLAPHTTVYKALATGDQLAAFYADLRDPDFTTRVVVAHRRFSTNTFSNWNLVQPFRHIAHNGEINTLTANCRAIRDAECAISLGNTLMNHGSDSAQLDRAAEMMAANGINGIHEALRRMIPPAWMEHAGSAAERAFFEANRRAMGTMGAWEGPAGIVATDGNILAGVVDRMGLRPLRYTKTATGRLIITTEAGAVPIDWSDIALDGQLEPGAMIIADLASGEVIPPESATAWIVGRTGLNFQNLATVDLLPIGEARPREPLPVRAQNTFGWTKERIARLREMIQGAKEPVVGMGNDTPLAIFSENHSRLSSFLHQIVAVVTNPPIDPLREGGAIDTTVYLGRSPRISKGSDYESFPQYELPCPVLTNEALQSLFAPPSPELQAHRLDATFADAGSSRAIIRRIHELTEEALEVIRSRRASILIVSDIEATASARLPLPMLLVVSSIHQALAASGLRRDASIVVETGEVHEGHDFTILLAYGATAVNPYAMFDIASTFADVAAEEARANVAGALAHTLKRIMSKMGITSIAGYRGSARFEAIGISSDVVEYYIPDTVSRLDGITMEDIHADIVARSQTGDDAIARNRNVSVYRREVTDALQMVARSGNAGGDYDRFVGLLEETPPVYLRDMLAFRRGAAQVPLDAVADTNEIVRSTIRGAAMSHGAINATAHRAIAAAFNAFGSMSNSGEGGEDPRRNPEGEWTADRSRIRQIASGRFGVDAAYLAGADEIEIKIGQGAKPGEGGHLPGRKVTEEIARIRKTKAGVDLISPPPHHDIYSIEDLKQLIANLRELHPGAVISVKVPSITDLGTIGVGIVKAGADVIVISGFEGGTGAASAGSIAHAGLPLERGVSEVHKYLLVNGVRSRVRIRADGGIKSGSDAAKIIALGADEVSVGTPLLVAERCIFCRGCSKGNCPVGIMIHDEEKQSKRFMPRSDDDGNELATTGVERYEDAKNAVARYVECLASHLRRILAKQGLTHPRELVGRVDLLEQIASGNPRWDKLDLTDLVMDFREDARPTPGMDPRPAGIASAKNQEIVEAARGFLEGRSAGAAIAVSLENSDHAIGATLAGLISRKGPQAPGGRIEIRASGYAGQGFGFAATGGMALTLTGFANDAVAEAMSGEASVVVVPPAAPRGGARVPHLIGNAAAYGATGGRLFVAGGAGQRFGVRNSGALLVCEGVGKYAFEYMTGGTGVVIGRCGPCIGSGMTGGELYLYDPDETSRANVSGDVTAHPCTPDDGRASALKEIIEEFFKATGSPTAKGLLDRWQEAWTSFLFVRPSA